MTVRKLRGRNLWRVYSRKGRNLGTFESREEAEAHLALIERIKHSKERTR